MTTSPDAATPRSAPPDPAARMAAIAQLSTRLRDGLTPRETFQAVIDAMRRILPADAYAVWRHDPRREEWSIVSSDGLSPLYVEHRIHEQNAASQLSRPFCVRDVYESPLLAERRSFYDTEGVRSILVLPLHVRAGGAGTLTCYFRKPWNEDPLDLAIGEIVANLLSAALEERKFDRFTEATRLAAAELDLDRLVQSITDAATELTNAQFGAFFYDRASSAGESLTLYALAGVPQELFERIPKPRITEVFGPVVDGRATVRSSNVRKDPRHALNPSYHRLLQEHLPVVSYLAVPVISRSGAPIGGLFFAHAEEGVFTEAEEKIAEALAAHASVAIDNASLYADLQRERALLARSEARYKSLVTAYPSRQAIWMTDAKGNVTGDLTALKEVTGADAGQEGSGFMEAVHSADREHAMALWDLALRDRRAFEMQFRLRIRDGSYRWFASTGAPVLDEEGNVVEWVGSLIDIHDRKITEDNLRFLADVSDVLASSLDYETTLTAVARLAVPVIADWCAIDVVDEEGGPYRRLAVAHVDPSKVALAHELRERYPPDPQNDVVTRVIRSGEAEWAAEIPREMLERGARDAEHLSIIEALGLLSYIAVPLQVHGRTLGVITFVLSDSRRRFTQTEFSFAEELARRAAVAIENARLYTAAEAGNRAKDEFLATLSHELRTPMTAVLGWSRMLKMGLDASETEEAVDAIERSATMQMQLIEDILDMSRIMAGKMRIDVTPTDLRAVTSAALDTVRPAAEAKGVEIFTSFDESLPRILGDESRLQQIVWNLLTNAVKFTPNGGNVMVKVAAGEGDVCLTVRDNGAGIEPSFLPHVFEPFRQADSSTTRSHGGIGLGLAIVRHLVELHGGRIHAQSAGPGLGATMIVEFPAHSRPTDSSARALPATPLASLNGARILVVDDEELTRGVVGAILRRAGALVSVAASAAEGEALLRRAEFDLVVSDIAMPHADGYAFLHRLRALEAPLATVPVIALTAFGRADDRDRAIASGFDAFLQKPVDPRLLVETIRSTLRR